MKKMDSRTVAAADGSQKIDFFQVFDQLPIQIIKIED